MRCTSCKRPIFKAAVSVTTKEGCETYGPKCAAKAGLIATSGRTKSTPPIRRWRAPKRNPDQIELEFNE